MKYNSHKYVFITVLLPVTANRYVIVRLQSALHIGIGSRSSYRATLLHLCSSTEQRLHFSQHRKEDEEKEMKMNVNVWPRHCGS